ncbi:MAG: hypothetical protein K2X38_24945 [Gemmataceae bacterium]|nr:hypothetical protein [Gemmataceae bacterium]
MVRSPLPRRSRRQSSYVLVALLVVGGLVTTVGTAVLWTSGIIQPNQHDGVQPAATEPISPTNSKLQALERQYEETQRKLASLKERQGELKRIRDAHNAAWDSESPLGAVPPDRLASRTKQINDDADAITANAKQIIATYNAMKTLLDQMDRESTAASQKITLWDRRQQLQAMAESVKEPAAMPAAPGNQPGLGDLATDFQRRVTAYQAGMRDHPWTWQGTDNKWRRSLSTMYEFRPEVKPSTQAGYTWVAELSYKEVTKSTTPCDTEKSAKTSFITEAPKVVWEHWRLFGYKDGRWQRIDRRMRSSGVINTDWSLGVADHPLLAIEDECFADMPR